MLLSARNSAHNRDFLNPVQAGCLTPRQFEDAVKPIRPALLKLALLQCQPDDAEDCVQRAVCNALFNLSRFHVTNESWPSALANWLRRILRNALCDFQRVSARRGEHSDAYLPEDSLHSEQEAIERAESLALHDELYHRLASVFLTDLQDACIRAAMGGQTYREIGNELGLSHVMVKYHVDAAANRLRKGEEYDVSAAMHVLFLECSQHATYTKPAGMCHIWMQQHPPEINLVAWKLRQARKKAVAAHKAAQKAQTEVAA